MPKKPRINWRSVDKKALSTAVRVFNSKLTRLSKKNPDLIPFLPARANVESLRSQITTRRDFNRVIASLGRFMRPGAEKPITSKSGIRTTAWEKREYQLRAQQISRNRAAERKRVNPRTETGTMGSIVSNNLGPKLFNIDTIKPSDWEAYRESVDYQVRDDYVDYKITNYKANYLDAILFYVNSAERADELYQLISMIPAETLYYAYYDDPILQINFISDPLEVNAIVDTIIEHWLEYIK